MKLAALLVAVTSSGAGPLDQGFHLLYHLKFEDARGMFAQYRQQQPNSAMGPAGEAASHLFEEFESHGVLTTGFFLDDETLLGGVRGERQRGMRELEIAARP